MVVADILRSPFYWTFLICYGVLFYSHTYVVYPKLYAGKKYVLYFFVLIALLVLVARLQPFDRLVKFSGTQRPMMPLPPRGPQPPRRMEHFDIISITLYFLTLAVSLAAITAEQLRSTKEVALQSQARKVEAELSLLKAQINPHFLFNSLNNIYALAMSKDDNTAPAILTLSNILRYVTEEVSHNFVPLDKEINCIRDYISLQELRMNKKMSVEFIRKGDSSGLVIAPMILMTFIENAFKYGVSAHHTSPISIRLETDNDSLKFSCRNTIFPSNSSLEGTGVGLKNTRQRLDLFYPGKYKLDIDTGNDFFAVNLFIERLNAAHA
jgi:sensor histidine kinase YesM